MTLPTTSLCFSSHDTFARIAAELYRRSGRGATEAGCFVLGRISGRDRTADEAIYFDDIDPNAYDFGAIRFDTTKLSAVYDLCEARALSIVGDIHVHPGPAFLSPIDEAHPVIAVAGHVSVILPYDGRYRTARQIAVNVYLPSGSWTELERGRCSAFLGLDRAIPHKESFDRHEFLLALKGFNSADRRALLDEVRVGVVADAKTCRTAQGQAAILTAVSLSTRFARGGVMVRLGSDARLHAMPEVMLSDEVQRLGGEAWGRSPESSIVLGADAAESGSFSVRPWSQGGVYGCEPATSDSALEDDYVPGAVAASALAVGEIFRCRILRKVEAVPRRRSLRLWTLAERAEMPRDFSGLIDALWLLGFGHLGNAYAWTIAQTPSLRPRLFVQDPQTVEVANASTQMLAVPADVGTPKVRVAERELARYGMRVEVDANAVDDRYLPRRHPKIILGGLDHVAPRRALSRANVSLIVDAGLGKTETTFSQFRVNTLTNPASVLDLFEESSDPQDLQARIITQPFAEIDDGTADARCALLTLANTAVAVPFVGCVVAPIVLTQALRTQMKLAKSVVLAGDVLSDLRALI